MRSTAKKASAFGAHSAAGKAYRLADSLSKVVGSEGNAMAMAIKGREKAKDCKLRSLAALKRNPLYQVHQQRRSGGGGGAGIVNPMLTITSPFFDEDDEEDEETFSPSGASHQIFAITLSPIASGGGGGGGGGSDFP